MIQVGNTGLYFDRGHKGNVRIYMRMNNIFRNEHKPGYILLDGYNADSSCEVFKAILEYADWKVDGERFLKNHEWLIKKCLEEQNSTQQRIVQCWRCGLEMQLLNVDIDEDGNEQVCCPPMRIDSDWDKVYVQSIPECDKHIFSIDSPAISIKDFDLRSEYVYGLHMVCKIKSIKKPVVKNGKYSQECVFYDDNTSKTIDALLDNNVAEFDKWNVGDKVELLGVYQKNWLSVTSMEILEENEIEEPIPNNRNQETPGYNEWRKSIIDRDKKCVCCGHNKHLEAHHLFGYKENPSLAINENNGVTLCKFCHDKYHSVYGLKNINPVDFMNFIKKYGVK